MSHLVTATIAKTVSIRVESVPLGREKIIGSGFTGRINDKERSFFFTEDGTNHVDMIISGSRTFDLDERIDKHNWIALQAYLYFNPDQNATLKLLDPRAETDKANALSAKSFMVESFLRNNETDKMLLGQVYRRIKGIASGIAEKVIFKDLIDLAKSDPNLFLDKVSGELIVGHQDFELYALLDLAIEKGIVFKDENERIKKDRTTIYATDIDAAVFQLKTDTEFRIYLQRGIEGRKVEKPYEPKFEDSDFVNMLTGASVGAEKEEALDNQLDLSIEEESDEVIESNITKFMEAGLIGKTGEKFNTKYHITDIPNTSFTKKQLVNYLQTNKSQYVHLKKMASIE